MQKLFIGTVVLLAMAFGASTANASQTEITLSSGTDSYSHIGSGTLSYGSLNFNGWAVVTETGITKSPDAVPYGIQLTSSVACFLGGCAPLTVEFSGTGFTTVAPRFFTTYNLPTPGELGSTSTTTQTGWYDTSDMLLATGGSVGSVGFSGGVSSGSKTAVGGGPASSYSLTVQDLFNSGTGPASFSANGEVGVTPEPSTMLLFGSGLLLLGGFLRRQLHHA